MFLLCHVITHFKRSVSLFPLNVDIYYLNFYKQISTVLNCSLVTPFVILQTVNAVVPLLFPRTKDDVKLSLVLESVPKLTKLLRQN